MCFFMQVYKFCADLIFCGVKLMQIARLSSIGFCASSKQKVNSAAQKNTSSDFKPALKVDSFESSTSKNSSKELSVDELKKQLKETQASLEFACKILATKGFDEIA